MRKPRNILITGAAGFIGSALAIKLINSGENATLVLILTVAI